MSRVPHISVILTVYKRTKYLTDALKSVLAQSYHDYEIIVADDSGTAAAKDIVRSFGDTKPARYLANPSTMGVASSIVRAAKGARGGFIAILNGDDGFDAGHISFLSGGFAITLTHCTDDSLPGAE